MSETYMFYRGLHAGKVHTLNRVNEFHQAFDLKIIKNPDLTDETTNQLRVSLIQEELDELKKALTEQNQVAALDALVDLQYVLDGTFISLGLAEKKIPAFEIIHASNMSKLGQEGKPIHREDGKAMKGPNYVPPDLERLF